MEPKTHRPDRGWAWVVAAGTTLGFFILGGFLKGFGILFVAFVVEYDAPASIISLILSVRAAVYAVTSPIATSLCDRFSERTILIIGGLLQATSCIVASQATNIGTLVFSAGVLMGIGLSCIFGPAQVAMGKYFDKRKSLAMGISFNGATLGQIVMSPLLVIMLEKYALRGTLLIYGALFLHIVVSGAVIRPVPLQALIGQPITTEISADPRHENDETNCPALDSDAEEKAVDIICLQTIGSPDIRNREIHLDDDETEIFFENKDDGEKDVQLRKTSSFDKNTRNSHSDIQDLPSAEVPRRSSPCNMCLKVITHVLDFSLCKNIHYVIYLISSTLIFVSFVNMTIFLFPRVKDCNIPEKEAALLLTIMGACELVGRFTTGLLADIKMIGPYTVYITEGLLMGIAGILFPFMTNFTEMAIISALLGFVGSASVVLAMPIVVELLGKHRLAKGLGMQSLFHGMLNSVVPPLLGLIRDVTGSYDFVFYLCGTMSLLGSCILLLDPIARRYGRRKRQSES